MSPKTFQEPWNGRKHFGYLAKTPELTAKSDRRWAMGDFELIVVDDRSTAASSPIGRFHSIQCESGIEPASSITCSTGRERLHRNSPSRIARPTAENKAPSCSEYGW